MKLSRMSLAIGFLLLGSVGALAGEAIVEAPSCTAGVDLEAARTEAIESLLDEFENGTQCPNQSPCSVISGCVDDECSSEVTPYNYICDGEPACPPGQTIRITTCTCDSSDPQQVCFVQGRTWDCV